MTKYQDFAVALLRIATAVNFLSPVSSRLGIWPGGSWQTFLTYAAQVNSYAPADAVPFLAVSATCLEITFALMILFGWRIRLAALGAGALTFVFGLAMAYSFGLKEPLDYAVPVDCTSALVLATLPRFRWSVDEWLARREHTPYPFFKSSP